MLDAGCSVSPSSNGQPRRRDSNSPIVDFPVPDTPMITRTTGECASAFDIVSSLYQIGTESEKLNIRLPAQRA
jgi:hypothetical protein